eukprot:4484315-Amphidinium_carterae.1
MAMCCCASLLGVLQARKFFLAGWTFVPHAYRHDAASFRHEHSPHDSMSWYYWCATLAACRKLIDALPSLGWLQ